jgi:hypothetical protein
MSVLRKGSMNETDFRLLRTVFYIEATNIFILIFSINEVRK